jgi:hypothetical protein
MESNCGHQCGTRKRENDDVKGREGERERRMLKATYASTLKSTYFQRKIIIAYYSFAYNIIFNQQTRFFVASLTLPLHCCSHIQSYIKYNMKEVFAFNIDITLFLR